MFRIIAHSLLSVINIASDYTPVLIRKRCINIELYGATRVRFLGDQLNQANDFANTELPTHPVNILRKVYMRFYSQRLICRTVQSIVDEHGISCTQIYPEMMGHIADNCLC